MKNIKSFVAGAKLEGPLRQIYRGLIGVVGQQPERKAAKAEFWHFCHEHGGIALRHNLLPRGAARKTALIASFDQVPLAKLEGVIIKAFQATGFETVILGTDSRRSDLQQYYGLAGAKDLVTWSDFGTETDAEWVGQQMRNLNGLADWLALRYLGVHVGRFALASTMRSLRKGQLDFKETGTASVLKRCLESSVGFVRTGSRIFEHIRPDCVLLLDRGYVGQGELFDLALACGIDALTWNGGHRSNALYLKRYNASNERDHHASLSTKSWTHMQSMPWKAEYGDRVREELLRCYVEQDWYSFVGTQFGKKTISADAVRQRLGLQQGKKVAVIFPHILWDGSFFWGEDLFDDYTHWFAETIRAACANPRLEWVVKLHPSHVVKAKKDNVTSRPQELDVIERTVGSLPAHVKLLHPENDISTYSVFEIADYTITVRGTVGIEASVFGIPVVTAGTGRYAGRGFTIDSATPQDYLDKLATLETLPPPSSQQIELAERYAFGVFFCRPFELSSVALGYERDAVASWKVSINCKTREDWLKSPDIRQFGEWISSKDEDMFSELVASSGDSRRR